MKTILCYGDSNTWGLDYANGGRIPFDERWPNVMQRELGDGYRVFAEGVNGRTSAQDDPADRFPEAKNGKKALVPCLRAHAPLDMVLLMLGTNDLKIPFFTSVEQIAANIGELAEITRCELKEFQGRAVPILLIAPMPIGDTIAHSPFCGPFGGEKAIEPSRQLAPAIRREAQRRSCPFLDAGEIASPNPVDAVHFTREGHLRFGRAAAQKVREVLADTPAE